MRRLWPLLGVARTQLGGSRYTTAASTAAPERSSMPASHSRRQRRRLQEPTSAARSATAMAATAPVEHTRTPLPAASANTASGTTTTTLCDIGINLKGSEDVAGLARRAADAGVKLIVITGTSRKSTLHARDVCREASDQLPVQLFYTAGVHPHTARQCREADVAMFEELFKTDSRCVAVGETGLDYHRMLSPRDQQLRSLDWHLRAAKRLDAPLFLHERDADERTARRGSHVDLVEALDRHDIAPGRVCVHCFTSNNKADLADYVRRGFMVGVTGFVCKRERGKHLAEAIAEGTLPLDQLLIETDSPYMAPPKWRGGRKNEPASLPLVAQRLAELYGVTADHIAERTTANAATFFGLGQR
eukprot:m.490980 g.490980  ORF g.490980 m.490980 type:complete len:361 (-) comp28978_c0_seq1:140-1222(-)